MKSNVTSIEIYKADDGYRWRAKAGNGEIVASGESHTTSTDAARAARGVFPGSDEQPIALKHITSDKAGE